MKRIEYGPTNDGRHLVKMDGVIVQESAKAGVAEAKAKDLAAKHGGKAVRTYFRASRPRSMEAPAPEAPADEAAPADERTASAEDIERLAALSVPKLSAELATGEWDHALDALEAAETAKASPRKGAIAAIAGRRDA